MESPRTATAPSTCRDPWQVEQPPPAGWRTILHASGLQSVASSTIQCTYWINTTGGSPHIMRQDTQDSLNRAHKRQHILVAVEGQPTRPTHLHAMIVSSDRAGNAMTMTEKRQKRKGSRGVRWRHAILDWRSESGGHRKIVVRLSNSSNCSRWMQFHWPSSDSSPLP